MLIKNIVFDVGNVLVRYDPHFIINAAFPGHQDPAELVHGIFKHQTWYELNLGHISEQEALLEYHARLGIDLGSLQMMAQIVKESLTPIPGSIEMLKQLHASHPLFALTDNTHEIMAYLQQRYDFWPLFKGIVVSAKVGYLKPSNEIFQHLLTTYQINPQETVFIDDLARNVEGAKMLGIHGIQFENTEQCIKELQKLQINI
ncbi:MAG: HAD family phosphatase [Gammaproteobacteria bacterium]|jgi:putative hydrolase of the HAD superfamily|nr:HAD family phosphatase [Gammaproteobacteria bacterium]